MLFYQLWRLSAEKLYIASKAHIISFIEGSSFFFIKLIEYISFTK